MNLMTSAHTLEDIITAKKRGKWYIRSNLWPQHRGRSRKHKEKLEYFYQVYLKPMSFRLLSIITAIFSLTIVFGESTLYLQQNIAPLRIIFQYSYGIFATEVLILIPLIYIVLASHLPLFEIRLEGLYGLYKDKNTQPSSLIYSACFLARLMPILSYNFLMLIKTKNTEFMELMKYIEFMPNICEQYFTYFPVVLILLCCLNGFNLYNKFVRAIGLGQFAFAEELKPERQVEGRMLIARDRMERERNLRHSKVAEAKSKTVSLLAEYERNFSVASSLNS